MFESQTKSVEVAVYKWYAYVPDLLLWIGITYGLLRYVDNFYLVFAFVICFPFLFLADLQKISWIYLCFVLLFAAVAAPDLASHLAAERDSNTTSQSNTDSGEGIVKEKSPKTEEVKPKVVSILDRPAAQNFNSGEALITLTQIYGIQLSDDNGPRTLRDVTDDYFDYLTLIAPRTITKESIDISFQPGGALYSYFSRLLNNTEAFDAVYTRLRNLAV